MDKDISIKRSNPGLPIKAHPHAKLLSALVALSLLSCGVKPEPLNIGKDACYTCKMTIMDKRFGAEIVTKKGKVYKFDDLNCMMNFSNSEFEEEEDIAYRLVVDFAHPEKLIDATQAFYSQSEYVKSPMASHFAAFEKKEDVNTFNKELEGVILKWEEIEEQFK